VSESISVLIIEDNRLLREGIAAMLKDQAGLEVVGTAPNSVIALELMRESKPQIVLLDSGLADLNSLASLRSVADGAPPARVIIMDLLPVQQEVVGFIQAGVSGFIAKDATLVELVSTLRSAAAGRSVLPSMYAETIFSHIAGQVGSRAPDKGLDGTRMTRREREVLELIGQGLSNKEIAYRLHLSTQTVKSHVHNILEKLALHTRLQLAAYIHR
jgi:DNA-binding NarL/FixJ family response regulator